MADYTKTIQTELKAITLVAANAQSVSSTLSCADALFATIFIDHARDAASAAVGNGTEYRVEVSQKASGDDTWRPIAWRESVITAPTAIVTTATEPAAETSIACSTVATSQVSGIIFFENSTLANSEWGKIVAVTANTSLTLQDGLTNQQVAGTYYDRGEQWVIGVPLDGITRLRVVCHNNKGTTNQAIAWRCGCITTDAIA